MTPSSQRIYLFVSVLIGQTKGIGYFQNGCFLYNNVSSTEQHADTSTPVINVMYSILNNNHSNGLEQIIECAHKNDLRFKIITTGWYFFLRRDDVDSIRTVVFHYRLTCVFCSKRTVSRNTPHLFDWFCYLSRFVNYYSWVAHDHPRNRAEGQISEQSLHSLLFFRGP